MSPSLPIDVVAAVADHVVIGATLEADVLDIVCDLLGMSSDPGRQALAEVLAEHERRRILVQLVEQVSLEGCLGYQRVVACQRHARAIAEGDVVDVVDAQDVVAGAADQAVWVGAAIEDIIARPAVEPVSSLFAQKMIVAAAA